MKKDSSSSNSSKEEKNTSQSVEAKTNKKFLKGRITIKVERSEDGSGANVEISARNLHNFEIIGLLETALESAKETERLKVKDRMLKDNMSMLRSILTGNQADD